MKKVGGKIRQADSDFPQQFFGFGALPATGPNTAHAQSDPNGTASSAASRLSPIVLLQNSIGNSDGVNQKKRYGGETLVFCRLFRHKHLNMFIFCNAKLLGQMRRIRKNN